jgi:hypothetical protein
MRPVGIIPGIFWDKMGQHGIIWDSVGYIYNHWWSQSSLAIWRQRWENDEGLAGIMMGNKPMVGINQCNVRVNMGLSHAGGWPSVRGHDKKDNEIKQCFFFLNGGPNCEVTQQHHNQHNE